MNIIKRVGAAVLLIVVLAVGIFAPDAVNMFHDSKVNNAAEMIDSSNVDLQIETDPEQILINKLKMVSDSSRQIVNIDTSPNMNDYEAFNKMVDELFALLDEPDLAVELLFGEIRETSSFIQTIVSEGRVVIVWRFLLRDEENNEVTVLLDDETGKILSLKYWSNYRDIFTLIKEGDLSIFEYSYYLTYGYYEYLDLDLDYYVAGILDTYDYGDEELNEIYDESSDRWWTMQDEYECALQFPDNDDFQVDTKLSRNEILINFLY